MRLAQVHSNPCKNQKLKQSYDVQSRAGSSSTTATCSSSHATVSFS